MVRRALVVLLLLLASALAGCRDESTPDDKGPIVETVSGGVRGTESGGVSSWRGIPYAAAPVGDLRWRAPEPMEPWRGTLEAEDYGPACLQGEPSALSQALTQVGASDEDCLTLNVHRPADLDSRGGDPLPVMVWVHGGALVHGSGGQPVYNSPELVRRGVVLVTLNYRLGRLGFLAHPALEAGEARVANFGLLDQVAALTWVQDNIAAFGGDPDNVTVFGGSAGGASVNALMASPAAQGLFDRAISQSGLGREPTLAWDDALADGAAVLEPLVGPDPSAEDLRALEAGDVMDLPTDLLSGQAPVLDDVLPAPVAQAFTAGDEAEVPYLNGTTDLELTDRDLADRDLEDTGRDPDRLRAAYGSDAEIERHLLSDVLFTEPARHLALAHADDAPTYRYLFGIAPSPVLEDLGGAPHTSEIVFVFDDTRRQGTPVEGADALADAIADLWVDFATDGEPDGWPRAESGGLMRFGLDGPVAGPDPWQARLDLVEPAEGPLA